MTKEQRKELSEELRRALETAKPELVMPYRERADREVIRRANEHLLMLQRAGCNGDGGMER
jgi:hypothetical protein